MKIILVEFSWQAKEIINNKAAFEKDVIVSLDPESSYILKSNKVSYLETYNICNHQELWSKYKDITNRTIKISKVLDDVLWKEDKRFRDLNWKFFDDHHYPLKISFDQLFYYSQLISKLIEKFNPSEIVVDDSNQILIDNEFKIKSQMSVIKFLLKSHGDNLNNIKISYIFSHQNKKTKNALLNNLRKLSILNTRNFIKTNCKNIYYKINFFINFYILKPQYLAIGCSEILKYKKLYPKESGLFLTYHHNNKNKNGSNDLTFFNSFINHLRNKTDFYDLIKHQNISFELIFHEVLLKLLQYRNFLINEFYKANRILNKIKPLCVIFQSTSPSYSANVTFRKACNDLRIPFVTWTHGGYGVSYSLPGYDITDFRFCKNHISYGPFLIDSIKDKKSVLKKLEFSENYNIFPIGSTKLDYINKNKKFSKILKPNEKKTILFLMGALVPRNRFYFGRNREKFETSLWEFQYEVFKLLKKYQKKYNIILKDYPTGRKSLWKKVLKDINANDILYISNEHSVDKLLRISDLNIMPWISTTFFEALYFNADIFVIDEDLFDQSLEKELKEEIFYFKNTKYFLSELERYLDDGNFYTRDKRYSKNYFLNLDYLNKRDGLLNKALSQLH